MPSISISDHLSYFYTDTGPAQISDYKTLVVFHGLSFHAGAFGQLSRLASDSRVVRIICVNRRHYPGTTPFTPSELRIFKSGTDPEKSKLLKQQGIELAGLIHVLIQQCKLPQSGGITLAGWSLGTSHMLSVVAAINHLEPDVRTNLQKYVKGFLLWEPPSSALGLPRLPNAYSPLWDKSIPPKSRGDAFGVWISSYFNHGNITKYGYSAINCGYPDDSKKSTVATLSSEQLSSLVDSSTVTDCDTAMLSEGFFRVLYEQTQKALFDPEVRRSWNHASFFYLHSDHSPWTFVYAAYFMREVTKMAQNSGYPIIFRCLQDANHFSMLENPEAAFKAVYDLITHERCSPSIMRPML